MNLVPVKTFEQQGLQKNGSEPRSGCIDTMYSRFHCTFETSVESFKAALCSSPNRASSQTVYPFHDRKPGRPAWTQLLHGYRHMMVSWMYMIRSTIILSTGHHGMCGPITEGSVCARSPNAWPHYVEWLVFMANFGRLYAQE